MINSSAIKIFIGADSDENLAWSVLAYSIQRRLQLPPAFIAPVALDQLSGILTRERHTLQSNEFSFARFLVPYLCGFKGWAIFMDCDMLCLTDIRELWRLRDPRYAVRVVKHDYTPHTQMKYLGRVQTTYEKKNWSSVMLMNCEECKALTPEYVNTATGLDLHQFKWLREDQVGALPEQWNHLVGYYPYNPEACLVHYTDGGPYFADYRNVAYASEWWAEYHDMLHVTQQRKPSWKK